MERASMKTALVASLVLLIAPAALAQKPPAKDGAKAVKREVTYEDALICYHYYSVAHDLARKLEKSPKSDADLAAGFELAALEARELRAHWAGRMKEVVGARSEAQVDADLKRVGAPIVSDANAALAGDRQAAERGRRRGVACAAYAFAPVKATSSPRP
jgi:hypothetical protein